MKLNMTIETRAALTERIALDPGFSHHIVTEVNDNTSPEIRSFLELGLARVAEGRSITPEDRAAFNDACNRKYLAQLAPEVRYEQGQANDPQCSLREEDENDPDGDIVPENACTESGHQRAANFHRAQATRARSVKRCTDCHNAADAHASAARQYPDRSASEAARAASRALKG